MKEFYTEAQVTQMLSSSVNQTMAFAENGGIMDEEKAQSIVKASFVHPSSFEIQKQIEAVRGLIEAREHFMGCKDADMIDDIHDQLENMEIVLTDSLHTLTETLKPYLDGEKLEV